MTKSQQQRRLENAEQLGGESYHSGDLKDENPFREGSAVWSAWNEGWQSEADDDGCVGDGPDLCNHPELDDMTDRERAEFDPDAFDEDGTYYGYREP